MSQNLDSSPKSVSRFPWKLFGGKSKWSTRKLKTGTDIEPNNDKVGIRRTLSKIKEQDETVFLQIQSKINPTPSFDVIRTISVQDDKIEKNSSKKSHHKTTSDSNQKVSEDSVKPQPQDASEEMFHKYHEKLHNHSHDHQSQLPAVRDRWAGTGQNGINSSDDASSCYSRSDGSVYSSDEQSYVSSEESFNGYTVDSSMSSVTVPMPVRTDSVSTSELFSLISTCAADAAAKLGNMCIYGDEEDDGTKEKEHIPFKLSEITVPSKSQK